ncbi:MAG: hypothetical protein QXM43_09410 [Desulfurococcaceae archaeon]
MGYTPRSYIGSTSLQYLDKSVDNYYVKIITGKINRYPLALVLKTSTGIIKTR